VVKQALRAVPVHVEGVHAAGERKTETLHEREFPDRVRRPVQQGDVRLELFDECFRIEARFRYADRDRDGLLDRGHGDHRPGPFEGVDVLADVRLGDDRVHRRMNEHAQRTGRVRAGAHPPHRLPLAGDVADAVRHDRPVVAGQSRKSQRLCLSEEPERVVPVEGGVERLVVADVPERRPERNGVAVDVIGPLVTLPVVVRKFEGRQHPRTKTVLRTGILVGTGPVEGIDVGKRSERPRHTSQPLGVHNVVVVERGDDVARHRLEADVERCSGTPPGRGAHGSDPFVVQLGQPLLGLLAVGVVHDHKFEMLIRLAEYRLDGFGEKAGAIACRRRDGHQRPWGHLRDRGDPVHDGLHFDSGHQAPDDVNSSRCSGLGTVERLGAEVGQRLHARAHPALERCQPFVVPLQTISHSRHLLQAADHFLLEVGHPRRLTRQHALQRSDLGLQSGQPFPTPLARGDRTGHRVRAGIRARHRVIVSLARPAHPRASAARAMPTTEFRGEGSNLQHPAPKADVLPIELPRSGKAPARG
jgi:hypothetical protein